MADDPYSQFDTPVAATPSLTSSSPPPHDPYGQFDDTASQVSPEINKLQTIAGVTPHQPTPQNNSFLLGLYKGFEEPVARATEALAPLDRVVHAPFDAAARALGLPSNEELMNQARKGASGYIARQKAAGINPSPTGEFVGNLAATLPITAVTKNPYAIGAGTGALLSEDNTPQGVLEDAALGGLGGKFADIGVRAVGKVLQPLAKNVARRVGQWTGSYSPVMRAADQAYDYVSGLLGSANKTPDDLRQAAMTSAGKPVLAAEAAGRPSMSALTALGRRQGLTPDALYALLSERAASAPDRMLADYAQAAGIVPEAAQGDIDALIHKGRIDARPLFDKALSQGATWNPELASLSERPVIQRAMGRAVDNLKNAGIDPASFGFTGPDATTGKFIQQPRPTAQAWDLVKKSLGTSVERDPFGRIIPDSQSEGNYNINQANRALTAALRKAIPGYGDALDTSGDYLGLQKAFQTGQSFIIKSTVTAKQLADHLSTLSEPEAQAFRGGVANKLFDLSQNAQLKPAIFNRPILQQKMAAVLGDAAPDFLNKMQLESAMTKTGARMSPGTNSVTSDVLNATEEQNQNSMRALIHGLYAGTWLAHGNGLWGGAHAIAAMRDLGMFGKTAAMPVSVRDEAGRLLMMKPEELADYLQHSPARYGTHSADSVAKMLSSIRPAAQIAGGAAAEEAAPSSP